MKFLTELPDEEFLRHCWQIADVVEEVLENPRSWSCARFCRF